MVFFNSHHCKCIDHIVLTLSVFGLSILLGGRHVSTQTDSATQHTDISGTSVGTAAGCPVTTEKHNTTVTKLHK